MPIHDWTRVSAGTFHDFHCSWVPEIKKALNKGILPSAYDSMSELAFGEIGSDQEDEYVRKQRRLVIRHSSDDRIIGFLEIVSPGNKASRHAWRSFVNKAVACLGHGYHLLLIDLFPPGPRDPQGVHGAVWSEINDDDYTAPPDKPLTLASYSAGRPKTAYVQPIAVGETLPDMPLFLDPETYVLVPLEATYQSAWEGVPHRWRTVLESPAT